MKLFLKTFKREEIILITRNPANYPGLVKIFEFRREAIMI